MDILWFMPTSGDGRYIGTEKGKRNVDYGYMKQIAIAADERGYDGILVPTGKTCEDAWVVASSLIPYTNDILSSTVNSLLIKIDVSILFFTSSYVLICKLFFAISLQAS